MNMRSHTQSITEELKKELRNNSAIELCAEQCGVIGDTNKLRICYLLRYHPELKVGDIAELTGMSVSNTSHALSRLRLVKLVKARKQAQSVFYSLEHNAFSGVLSVIGGTNG